jgi:hypothetical protein
MPGGDDAGISPFIVDKPGKGSLGLFCQRPCVTIMALSATRMGTLRIGSHPFQPPVSG